MNKNNYMHTLFRDMKQGFAENNMDVVEQCVRCWMQLGPENPFTYDTPEYEEFFQMQKCYTIWARGDIDQKINRRRMVQHAKKLCEINPKQPYVFDRKAEQEEKKAEEERKKNELLARQERDRKQQEKEEQQDDSRFVLLAMTKAYNMNDKVSFEQYTIHLMDITKENPFKEGSIEYEKFNEMLDCYNRKPMNMRRVYVVAGQLCEIINNTEIYPEYIEPKKVVNKKQETVLGVLPEGKKSWFKFLHRKKEGE